MQSNDLERALADIFIMKETLLSLQNNVEDPATAWISINPVKGVESLTHLNEIDNDDTEAIIWERSLPSLVQTQLNNWPLETLSDFRGILKLEDVCRCVESYFSDKSVPSSMARDWMINDITSLAFQVGKQFETSHLRLRIEIVNDDACRKFHIDAVKARLICTYIGPGTEYGLAEGNDDPVHIARVPKGMPMLFKGKAWDGINQKRLKHRSPPISGQGVARLVVVLEPVSAETEDYYSSVLHQIKS